MIETRDLLQHRPIAPGREAVEVLAAGPAVRIERILSNGQAWAAGFWYDQGQAEWVMVLSGRARLEIEGQQDELDLKPGMAVLLPAHCRHRVTWADPDQPTVWIAVFFDEAARTT